MQRKLQLVRRETLRIQRERVACCIVGAFRNPNPSLSKLALVAVWKATGDIFRIRLLPAWHECLVQWEWTMQIMLGNGFTSYMKDLVPLLKKSRPMHQHSRFPYSSFPTSNGDGWIRKEGQSDFLMSNDEIQMWAKKFPNFGTPTLRATEMVYAEETLNFLLSNDEETRLLQQFVSDFESIHSPPASPMPTGDLQLFGWSSLYPSNVSGYDRTVLESSIDYHRREVEAEMEKQLLRQKAYRKYREKVDAEKAKNQPRQRRLQWSRENDKQYLRAFEEASKLLNERMRIRLLEQDAIGTVIANDYIHMDDNGCMFQPRQ